MTDQDGRNAQNDPTGQDNRPDDGGPASHWIVTIFAGPALPVNGLKGSEVLYVRAFEANAKAVTTFDQITQDTINLKQG